MGTDEQVVNIVCKSWQVYDGEWSIFRASHGRHRD
jgi:hypothetical protein